MNKQTFATILNVALLYSEGVSENELLFQYGFNNQLIKIGIKVCEDIKKISPSHYQI